MRFVLANLFGAVSGSLIMFFVFLICEVVLASGLKVVGLLLIPFTLGWILAVVITRPGQSTAARVLDRGLLLIAILWGLAFPSVFVAALTSELEIVTSASVVGYALGGLLIGGGVTLLGIGMFLGARFVALRLFERIKDSASGAEAG